MINLLFLNTLISLWCSQSYRLGHVLLAIKLRDLLQSSTTMANVSNGTLKTTKHLSTNSFIQTPILVLKSLDKKSHIFAFSCGKYNCKTVTFMFFFFKAFLRQVMPVFQTQDNSFKAEVLTWTRENYIKSFRQCWWWVKEKLHQIVKIASVIKRFILGYLSNICQVCVKKGQIIS